MYKFAKFGTILARLQALPNVVVRLSSDSITGETVPGVTTSTIATLDTVPQGAVVCARHTQGKASATSAEPAGTNQCPSSATLDTGAQWKNSNAT